MRNYILLIAGLAMMASCKPSSDIDKLSWLEGDWYVTNYGTYEKWETTDEGIRGWGYRNPDNFEDTWEDILIHEVEGEMIYSVTVKGQNDDKPIDYKMTVLEEGKVSFENKEHDFPQTITYSKTDDGMLATLTGMMQGTEQSMEFDFVEKSKAPKTPNMGPEDSRLGSAVQISIGATKGLATNVEFFQALGYQLVFETKEPYPFASLTDGSILIGLGEDGMGPYIGPAYFSMNADSIIRSLQDDGINVEMLETNSEDQYTFGVVMDPDQKTGIAVIQAEDMANHPVYPLNSKGIVGKFGEFAIPVKDFKTSAEFWESLGFKKLSEQTVPYPWGIFTDGLMVIGLHQTDDFDQPAITYFGLETEEKIKQVMAAGIEVKDAMEEMMGPSEVIEHGSITTPEGHFVFLFKGAF